jgi:hypothetical protein
VAHGCSLYRLKLRAHAPIWEAGGRNWAPPRPIHALVAVTLVLMCPRDSPDLGSLGAEYLGSVGDHGVSNGSSEAVAISGPQELVNGIPASSLKVTCLPWSSRSPALCVSSFGRGVRALDLVDVHQPWLPPRGKTRRRRLVSWGKKKVKCRPFIDGWARLEWGSIKLVWCLGPRIKIWWLKIDRVQFKS